MKKALLALAMLWLVILPVLVYLPSLTGGFLWDDDHHVTDSLPVTDPHGLDDIWFVPGAVQQYYPVTHSAFWLQYQLWQDYAPGYRVVNVLLHGLCAVMVFLILRKLALPGAFVVAMIFAVHPVHVESVAWISELKNVLSGVFYLLALRVYLSFAGPLDQPMPAQPRWWLYGVAMGLFVLAILSKSVTVSLPAVIFLLLWWRRPRLRMADMWPLVPMLVLGVLMAIVTIQMEKHFIGAQGSKFDYTPIDRVLIAGRALWFYFTKLIWPDPLIFFYPRWSINATAWQQYIYPAGVLIVMGTLFALRNRIGKGPLVAVLFFAGTLLPALGFINVFPFIYSFVADHFQYLASLGIMTLIVVSLSRLSLRAGKPGQITGSIVAAAVVIVLGVISWNQSQAYLSREILYKDVIAKNPRAWMAYNNLANQYIREERWDEARVAVEASLEVNPQNDRALKTMANVHRHFDEHDRAIDMYIRSLKINPHDITTHLLLAEQLLMTGQLDYARHYISNAMRIDSSNPRVYVALGDLLVKQQRPTDAQKAYTRARELDFTREMATPLLGLAQVHEAQGNIPQAISYYKQGLALAPEESQALNNLATLQARTGKTADALENYHKALAAAPDMIVARRNLASLLVQLGRTQEALSHYQMILQADPDSTADLLAMADAHAMTGELDQAQAQYESLLQRSPDLAMAHNNLGALLMMKHQDKQAMEHINTAIKLDSKLIDAWYNRGLLHLKLNRLGPAGRDFEQVLRLDANHGMARFQVAQVLEAMGRQQQAIAQYRLALERLPQSPLVMQRLAWLLATTTEPGHRAPQEAIELATAVVKKTRRQDPVALDTLAVAYGAAGLYKDAITTTNQAIRLANSQNREDLTRMFTQHMAFYRANQPIVASPVLEGTTPAPAIKPLAEPLVEKPKEKQAQPAKKQTTQPSNPTQP